jgi:hypothetical protein
MSWLDKVATFFGGHRVEVVATAVEGRPPEEAFLPVADSVIKGQYEIRFDRDVEVVAHIAAFYLQKKDDDGTTTRILLAEDRHDADNQATSTEATPPYHARPGQIVKTSFCIVRVDIDAALKNLGYAGARDANRAEFSYFLDLTVDVGGTVLDAECIVPVRILL